MSDGKVVYLKFKSEQLDEDTMAFLACKVCKNKTFTHTFDDMDNFPLVRCAACGQHIGRVGYADTKDPEAQAT
mgnify:CR=1 FL=1